MCEAVRTALFRGHYDRDNKEVAANEAGLGTPKAPRRLVGGKDRTDPARPSVWDDAKKGGCTMSGHEKRVIGVETCLECERRYQVSARGFPAIGTEFFKCDCGHLLKTWTGLHSFAFDKAIGERPTF